jgi:EAL domain-containing protein (putative c-di-GMP-specific phosphodiesterase class I)
MVTTASQNAVLVPEERVSIELLDDFAAVLEPIIDLTTGAVAGHELLLRPRRGGTLLSWHRSSGVATWRAFTQQVLVLAATALELRDLPLHVNVTALDLGTPGFASQVTGLVAPMACRRLVLELTEQFPVLDGPTTAANLDLLRQAGVRVAIDDYGEGWSGQATVLFVRPEVVKVTVAMLQVGDAERTADRVLTLASHVGATTVIEQIERSDQLGWAVDIGFSLGQGYLWDQEGGRLGC